MRKYLIGILLSSLALAGSNHAVAVIDQRNADLEKSATTWQEIRIEQTILDAHDKAVRDEILRAESHSRDNSTEVSRGSNRVITVEATAYTTSADECGKSDGITASGAVATPHYTVAADDLPFGTRLLINGKVYEVQDCFGAGHQGRIDICMGTKDECFSFGRRTLQVEVLD